MCRWWLIGHPVIIDVVGLSSYKNLKKKCYRKKTQQTYTYSGPVPLIQARNAAHSYSYFFSCSSVCGEHNIIVGPMLMTVVMWQPTEVYVYTIMKCQGGLGWS